MWLPIAVGVAVILLPLVIINFFFDRSEPAHTAPPPIDVPLTPKRAQAALRELLSDPFFGGYVKQRPTFASLEIAQRADELSALEKLEIEEESPKVYMGGWWCNLEEQSFRREFRFRDFSEGWKGEFFRDESGKWKARLTSAELASWKSRD